MAEVPEREAGEVLDGRYQLIERLGRGGFGDVWRAEELLPDGTSLREVALKLLHAHMADSQDWTAEARIIASFRHPALVTIYAAGVLEVDRRIPFVAMELLHGESLGDFVKRGECVPWRRLLSWARAAAAALDEIHRAGVVHLDLKPANLFLSDTGEIKVLDFGIARQGMARAAVGPAVVAAEGTVDEMSTAAFMVAHEREGAGGTIVGATSRSVVGTPGFMAPEIFEDGEATPAADAYALAACIVQLASGRLPQDIHTRPEGDSGTTVHAWFADVQAATVRGRIRDLVADHPELPRAMTSLLHRWLALDPVTREVTRGGMCAALDEVWRCPDGFVGIPYRGLSAYGIRDEGKLFGRSAEVERVARELEDVPGVVLQGDASVGLLSLALAGVVPALARRFTDERHDWMCCEVRLRRDEPADGALREALERFLATHPRPGDDEGDDLLERLRGWVATTATGLVVVVDDLHCALDDSALRLVDEPVDDAAPRSRAPASLAPASRAPASARAGAAGRDEEQPVADPGADDRRLLAGLLELVAGGQVGLRLVATLRAAYTGELLALPDLSSFVRPWLRFVSPLQASVVDDIVVGPAAASGRELVGGDIIIDALQAELGADGTRLGLVSLALEEWWDACGDGTLSADVWRDGEGVMGCIRRHADRLMDELSPEERALSDAVLLRLVSVEGQLLEVPERELEAAAEDPLLLGRVIERLVAARLLVRGKETLMLGHPGLVDRWPRLHDLRLHDMDRLAFLEELRAAAKRWTMAGRARAQLWPADRVREYRRRKDDIAGDLTQDERAFSLASVAAQRLGWGLRAFAVLLALGAVVLAWWVDHTMDERAKDQAERLEQARHSAALGRMVTRSRRTADPYVRVALLSAAVELGSRDPVLPLELFASAQRLPRARFLSLDKVSQPSFPWGQRWLLAAGRSHTTVFDFEPAAGPDFAPFQFRFQAHADGTHDLVPLPFDTAFVSRGLDGTLRVWRLEEDGQLALAALSPMKCVGGSSPLLVAEAAPVIACTSETGVAWWDLRQSADARIDPFVGRLLDISPDGRWLAATRLREVLVWSPPGDRRQLMPVDEPPNLARFSPRDELVALVRAYQVEVLDLTGASLRAIVSVDTLVSDPVGARWSPGGVDLAVCNYSGEGDWHYLRTGKRAAEDAPPPVGARPCDRPSAPWPRQLHQASQYDARIASRQVGPRLFEGGWQLKDGRQVTRDLVMFDPEDRGLDRLTRFVSTPKEPGKAGDSAAAVIRDGDDVVWQVGEQVRIHDGSGAEILRRDGRLLGRCPDGRLLAYRKDGGGGGVAAPRWLLLGVKHEVRVGLVAREPAFVLGVDPDCERVYFQRHDGELAGVTLGDGNKQKSLERLPVAGGGFVADGYVYDARPSAGDPHDKGERAGQGRRPGLWMALSSGAMIRVDARGVEAWGHAAARASVMADGPEPGELMFADESGVVVRRQGARDRRVLGPDRERQWSDLVVLPDRKTALLAWAHGVAVLDLQQAELVGDVETRGRGRLAAWDQEGSVLVWPFDFMGQPEGEVIPISRTLAAQVGAAASNLRANLGAGLQPMITLHDR